MSFTLEAFARTRPFLYHLTARGNVPRIARTRRLVSAMRLMEDAGRSDLVRERRRQHEIVMVAGEAVSIRDQAPLHEGNLELVQGWTLADLVEHLNSRVFFWPGKDDGPNPNGCRHWNRYETERPSMLRMPFVSLLAVNAGVAPEFCAFNSGSPRYSKGRRSPRSSSTFARSEMAAFSPSETVEVTFTQSIRLPEDAELGASPQGAWRPLALV